MELGLGEGERECRWLGRSGVMKKTEKTMMRGWWVAKHTVSGKVLMSKKEERRLE